MARTLLVEEVAKWAKGLWQITSGRGRKPNGRLLWSKTSVRRPRGTLLSTRRLVRVLNTSAATVCWVWQTHQLKPHLEKGLKVSREPKLLSKLTDVVGLYLTPPAQAAVLCVNEKSQIQTLDWPRLGLPLKKGRCDAFTREYKA